MSDSRMLAFWCVHWDFRVVELKASLGLGPGPPAFNILVLEFTKHKQTLRIPYIIVIPIRNVPAVRIGLLYSSIVTVKPQKQIGNNTAFLSVQEFQAGLVLFIKTLYRWLCYVLLCCYCLSFVSSSFPSHDKLLICILNVYKT